MNTKTPSNSFRFPIQIPVLVLAANLVSLSSFLVINQPVGFAKSAPNNTLNVQSHQLGILKINPYQNSTLMAQDGLIQVPDDRRFIDQNFSQTLFWNIPWWGDACHYYNLNDYCSYQRRHLFNDVTLITEAVSYESSKATLEFKSPVAFSEAIAYARIIGRGDMRLDSVTSRSAEKIVYDETDPEFNGGGRVELYLTPSGEISTIVYSVSSP